MATREIIEIPDSKSGDINELRDKKIALASKASGATDITAQCEYLIKNGQTGEFMNVLKSYIDESVRSALGALVNNLDKGSSIKSVLATDSSNDLGSITPANLASVLGVPSWPRLVNNSGQLSFSAGEYKDFSFVNPGALLMVCAIYNGEFHWLIGVLNYEGGNGYISVIAKRGNIGISNDTVIVISSPSWRNIRITTSVEITAMWFKYIRGYEDWVI